jgi:8-oxo-dGTP pyrophosphatase MutT (NUDIX family)
VSSSFDPESLKQRLRDSDSVNALETTDELISAVAIIINSNRDGSSVLLIRRRDRPDDPWSGQIAFPGGHKSKEDQTLLQTAIREAAEEVGIDLNEHRLLGVLPLAHAHTRSMPVFPYVFELKKDVMTRYNEEVAEGFWVPLESLLRMRAKSSQVEVEQGRLNVHSYVIKEHVIWGLTFRILNVLLNKP